MMKPMRFPNRRSLPPGLLAAVLGLFVPVASARVAVAAPEAARPDLSVKLGLGQNKVLNVPGGVSRIAVGDPEVADVKAIGSGELLVLGVAEGKTTLLVWKPGGERVSYSINVRKQPPEEIAAELKTLLGEVEGVDTRIVGDRVYLDGETLTTADADRVKSVVALFPAVKSFVRPSPNALKVQAKTLAKSFSDAGLAGVVVNVVGNTIFLEGSVEAPDEMKKAELLVKAMGAPTVENLITVGLKRMVLVEAQIVEIRRSDDKGIGITYPTNLSSDAATLAVQWQKFSPPSSGQLPEQTTYNANVGVSSNLALRMRFDSGYGRLLSQPRLVCSSGEKAHFTVGGEVPIPMVTANTASVEWKEFGVILDLTPTADRQGNISTQVSAEVSDIDASLTVRFGGSEMPGFRKRKVDTNVTVKQGETIVLSGLFNYDQQKSVSKVPLLGHIPILGELFKSRAFIERKSELAIFITPKLVNPDSDRVRETIERIKERYKDAEDSVGYTLWD
jgi:pilus assembly protein CpaC